MQLQLDQVERRLEHLGVRRPERHRRLLASLAPVGGFGRPRNVLLEEVWLLVELEQRFGAMALRSWRAVWIGVGTGSRRMGLVELLPDSVQQQVRT